MRGRCDQKAGHRTLKTGGPRHNRVGEVNAVYAKPDRQICVARNQRQNALWPSDLQNLFSQTDSASRVARTDNYGCAAR